MRPLTVVIKIDNYIPTPSIPSFCRSINGIIRNKKKYSVSSLVYETIGVK